MKTANNDYLLAALAYVGVFTIEQAAAISSLYHAKRDYDNPVPINFGAALDQVVPLFEEIDDDHAVAGMLGHGPGVGECKDCGQPIDAHANVVSESDGDDLSDQDARAALSLWIGLKGALASILR